MSRFKLAVVIVAVLSAAACNRSNQNLVVTTPSPVPVTDTFSGTLNKNGATSFAFSVAGAGYVYATLTTVADSSTVVGMSLGTWSGDSCSTVLSNDAAVQGVTITGTVTGIGTLCARVYDVGKVVDPLDYQITVVHP
jgi:hypothetical protein